MGRLAGLLRVASCEANGSRGMASKTPMKSTARAPLGEWKVWTGERQTARALRLIASSIVCPAVIRPLPCGQGGIAYAEPAVRPRGAEILLRDAECAASGRPQVVEIKRFRPAAADPRQHRRRGRMRGREAATASVMALRGLPQIGNRKLEMPVKSGLSRGEAGSCAVGNPVLTPAPQNRPIRSVMLRAPVWGAVRS